MIGLPTAPLAPGGRGRGRRASGARASPRRPGEAMFTEEDSIAVWQRPSFDFARHTVGVRDVRRGSSRSASWSASASAFVRVLPSHRGRGDRRWLMRWTQERPGPPAGAAPLRRSRTNERPRGRRCEPTATAPRWEAWMLRDRARPRAGPARRSPRGLRDPRLRRRGGDDRAVYGVIDDAFAEWPERRAGGRSRTGRPRRSAGRASRPSTSRPSSAATRSSGRGACRRGGRWAGSTSSRWRAARGRGLARALLVHAFGIAWRAGGRRCGLCTDSRTGARGLYERVGMRVTRTAGSLLQGALMAANHGKRAAAARADGAGGGQPVHGRAAVRDLGRLTRPGRRRLADDDGRARRRARCWRSCAGALVWALHSVGRGPRRARGRPAARVARRRGCGRSTARRAHGDRQPARARQGARRRRRARRARLRGVVLLLRRLLDRPRSSRNPAVSRTRRRSARCDSRRDRRRSRSGTRSGRPGGTGASPARCPRAARRSSSPSRSSTVTAMCP